MDIGKIIYNRRMELGLTLEEVGAYVGVGKSTVKKWESGFIENMKRDKIALLGEILKLNPLTFITGEVEPLDDKPTVPDNIIPLPKFKKVPLIGAIACGEPILAVENIDSYINMAEDINADFALKCKGDSMINARIFDGDYVYIRTQEDVDDGEIAAVLIGDEATLKRVHKYPGKLVLSPCNPMYDDLVYQNEQLNDIRILGKAVAFLSAIR